MFAAKKDRKFPAADDLDGDAANLCDDLFHRCHREFDFWQREDADAVDVGLRLFVPQFHVRRGDEDLVRTCPRAGHV